MSKLIPAFVVSSFLLFVVLYGAFISGLVLREPDICFLLASGRWIVEHGQIPPSDPFSYSTIYHNQPYVIEKWLTEIIFYQLWKWTGTAGLLVFDAIILAATFVVMPFRILRLSGVSGMKALLFTWLATLTSFCHLAVRPEIFSYLFIAIFLEVLIRLNKARVAIQWRAVLAFTILMALWANLHTLFLVGLLLLLAYTGCEFAESVLPITDERKKIDWTIPIAFCTCLAATFATPYGVTLWQYIPNIFGPFNDTNNEMQPLGLSSYTNVSAYPFFVLIIVSMYMLLRRGMTWPLKSGDLFFKLLIPAGIVGGIRTARTMPISDLLITTGLARVCGLRPGTQSQLDMRIDDLCRPLEAAWIATILLAAGLGSYLMTYIIVPEIPEDCAAFHPPVKAVQYIGKTPPSGRQLNDPHFGNVLIWHLPTVNGSQRVFIDSRYNLYGNTVLQDYWKMALCRQGWHDLLDKYAIDWVFLTPDMPLIKSLSKDAEWKMLYQDERSAIYGRHQHK